MKKCFLIFANVVLMLTKMNFVVSETSKHRPLKKLMELDKSIYGIKKLAGAMLLNRGVNFYIYMFISFNVVLVATLKLKQKKNYN